MYTCVQSAVVTVYFTCVHLLTPNVRCSVRHCKLFPDDKLVFTKAMVHIESRSDFIPCCHMRTCVYQVSLASFPSLDLV